MSKKHSQKIPAKTAAKVKAKPVTSIALPAVFNTDKKKVLHVGCSTFNPQKLNKRFQTPEWQEIRADIDPSVNPDIVCDMCDMSMIPEGGVDAVWSSHNVEHLYPHEVDVALKEFHRVLSNGGFVLITLPDLMRAAEHIAAGKVEEPIYTSPAGPIYAIDILYGYRPSMAKGNLFMAHKNAFTALLLGRALRAAGFANIRVQRDGLDLWAVAHKIPRDSKEFTDRITLIDDRAGNSGAMDELDRPPFNAWNIQPPLKSGAQ